MTHCKIRLAPHRVIYGKTRVGGVMVYAGLQAQQMILHIIFTIAGHEINDITKLFKWKWSTTHTRWCW